MKLINSPWIKPRDAYTKHPKKILITAMMPNAAAIFVRIDRFLKNMGNLNIMTNSEGIRCAANPAIIWRLFGR
ncbi:hypothetical protein NFHSH190041_12050 [Shewanella sp. NFH-SH190041]|nr:hypothetical protein NFHSH190041_12050 [Shewanella sp. NFH-SH190041]